jgi:hypothetical protein
VDSVFSGEDCPYVYDGFSGIYCGSFKDSRGSPPQRLLLSKHHGLCRHNDDLPVHRAHFYSGSHVRFSSNFCSGPTFCSRPSSGYAVHPDGSKYTSFR